MFAFAHLGPLALALALALSSPALALVPPPLATVSVSSSGFSRTFFASPAYFGAALATDPADAPALQIALGSSLDASDAFNFACGALPAAPVLPDPGGGGGGWALLVSRGNCSFWQKARFAAAAGARALLVFNGLAGLYANANASGAQAWPAVGDCDFDCAQGSATVSAADAADRARAYAGFPAPGGASGCGGGCASALCALTPLAPDAATGARQVCCVPNDLVEMAGGPASGVSPSDDADDDGGADIAQNVAAAFISAGDGASVVAAMTAGVVGAGSGAGLAPFVAVLAMRPVPFVDAGAVLLWLLGTCAAALASWVSAGAERAEYLDRLEGLEDDDDEGEEGDEGDSASDSERRRLRRARRRARRAAQSLAQPAVSLSPRQALLLLGWSCCVLLALYFLSHYGPVVVYAVIALFALGALSALAALVCRPAAAALLARAAPRLEGRVLFKLPAAAGGGDVTPDGAAGALAAGAVVLTWVLNRNASWAFALQDALGLALCCLFLLQLRVETLRSCALVLSAFFAYDIFMVFITPYIFGGESVMIEVATAGLPTPVANQACWCRLHPDDAQVCGDGESMPILLRLPRLNDFRGGYSMLGLGDVVLPGLLLSLALRLDYEGTRGLGAAQAATQGRSSDADAVVPPADSGATGAGAGGAGAGGAAMGPGLQRRVSGSGLGRAGGNGGGGGGPAFAAAPPHAPAACASASEWLEQLSLELAKRGVLLRGYWAATLAGYAAGLMMANLAVAYFEMGQPALLYLVPCTLLAAGLVAVRKGEFDAVWRGRAVGEGAGERGQAGAGGELSGENGRRASLVDNDALAAAGATMVEMPEPRR